MYCRTKSFSFSFIPRNPRSRDASCIPLNFTPVPIRAPAKKSVLFKSTAIYQIWSSETFHSPPIFHKTMLGSRGSEKAVAGSIPDVRNAGNSPAGNDRGSSRRFIGLKPVYTGICIVLLFINYFLAQYDKFILSYFQTPLSSTLNL